MGTLHRLPSWAERGLLEMAWESRSDGVLILNEGLMLLDPFHRAYRLISGGEPRIDGKRPLPPKKLERRLRDLFATVEYSGHYSLSPIVPAIDRRTPFPVPERLAKRSYDLDTGCVTCGCDTSVAA